MTLTHSTFPQYHRRATRRPAHHEFLRERSYGDACCRGCRAVHHNKRWTLDDDLRLRFVARPTTSLVLCPGCLAVQNERVDGVLLITSPRLLELKEELTRLIRHEVALEQEKNPAARVVDALESPDVFEVRTSTQFLAMRLGHAIRDAFHGHLGVKRLRRTPFVRVHWEDAHG